MAPRLTVIVPTRDRPGPLARCLDALGEQDEPVSVIVVDDGSVDAAAVAGVCDRPRVQLVRAAGEGPAAARNRGAARADSDYLAFTDDDCAPDPGWSTSLLLRLTEDGAEDGADRPTTVVAGPTENGRPEDRWAAASQLVTNQVVDHSLDPDTGTVAFAPTSNLAMTRAVHEAVPFDEDFPLAAGEDRDHCARVVAAGHTIAWEPAARVRHFQDLGPRGFWRQQHRYGQGAVAFRAAAGGDRRRSDLGFYADLARSAWAAGPTVAGLVLASQVATAAGMVNTLRTRGV